MRVRKVHGSGDQYRMCCVLCCVTRQLEGLEGCGATSTVLDYSGDFTGRFKKEGNEQRAACKTCMVIHVILQGG